MKRFKNILYVLQGEVEQQNTELARAVALAQNNQATLSILEILPDLVFKSGGHVSSELKTEIMADRLQVLKTALQPYSKQLNIKIDVVFGKSFLEVIRAVLRESYDLVIKPAENPDFLSKLFGSEDMHLLRKCPCAVWLMKPNEAETYRNILAALDFSTHITTDEEEQFNQQILELSAFQALADFGTLHLVHAWESLADGKIQTWSANHANVAAYLEGEYTAHEAKFHQLGAWLKNELGKESYDYLAPHFHLRKGNAAQVIANLVNELPADLIVMGTIGRTGIAGLIIGNTAETILEQVNCSVLALKPASFVSPITLA